MWTVLSALVADGKLYQEMGEKHIQPYWLKKKIKNNKVKQEAKIEILKFLIILLLNSQNTRQKTEQLFVLFRENSSGAGI